MRFYGITKVMIPWTDTEGMRQWSVLTFNGDVDRRRIWREIRKFCLRNFKKQVPKQFIRSLPITNTYDPRKKLSPTEATQLDKAIEAWIDRMQDETEAGTDTADQTSDVGETTGVAVSDMPN